MGAREVGPWVGEQKPLGKSPLRGNPSSESTYLPTFNLHCEASQYKLKMSLFTNILQSLSMKRLKQTSRQTILRYQSKNVGYLIQHTPDFGPLPVEYS